MQKNIWLFSIVALLSACAQEPVERSGSPQQNPPVVQAPPKVDARLAGAILNPVSPEQVRGRVHFEQMPNSTISMYRLDGLQREKFYQVSVLPGNTCEAQKNQVGVPVYQFKTNKSGFSESTFKIESFTVSGKNPLLGQSIVVSYLGNKKESPVQAVLACGVIDAVGAEALAPSAPGAEAAPEVED